MGSFLVLAGVVLGAISGMLFIVARALPQQLFAGEMSICASVLFAGGAIVMAIDKLRPVPPAS